VIEELLPDEVVAVEVHGDDGSEPAPLYPEEAEVVAQAVHKRRREFALVRACARRAMEKLGVPAQPLLPGERGAPGWPPGLAGSMTHCDGYRAAAVAYSDVAATIGVDAEPHEPLPHGVAGAVTLPAEREWLSTLSAARPDVYWDRLLFSVKESVYKAWFPLTRRWLDFEQAAIRVDPDTETFTATLLVDSGVTVNGAPLKEFTGRWLVRNGVVASAIVVPRYPRNC
jgi:4'-phosphopantetheinyl transferase EntD